MRVPHCTAHTCRVRQCTAFLLFAVRSYNSTCFCLRADFFVLFLLVLDHTHSSGVAPPCTYRHEDSSSTPKEYLDVLLVSLWEQSSEVASLHVSLRIVVFGFAFVAAFHFCFRWHHRTYVLKIGHASCLRCDACQEYRCGCFRSRLREASTLDVPFANYNWGFIEVVSRIGLRF